MLRFLIVPLALWAAVLPAEGGRGTLSAALASDREPVAAEFRAQWCWQLEGHRLVPVAIDAHPSGVVCGLEASRRRLVLADSLGGAPRLASGTGGDRGLGSATHLYARVGLQIFALDAWNARVERYDLQGMREAILDLAAAAAAAGEELREAADFCLDPSGELFVLDAQRGRVLHFSREGEWIEALAETGEISFVEPVAIDVDGRGRLYLLESRPPTLIVLDADGRLLRRAPLPAARPVGAGAAAPALRAPSGLVVDPWGNAYVADADEGVLVVPERGAAPWWVAAPEGARIVPADLGLSGNRSLLIADAVAGCVWVYDLRYRVRGATRGADAREPPARSGE